MNKYSLKLITMLLALIFLSVYFTVLICANIYTDAIDYDNAIVYSYKVSCKPFVNEIDYSYLDLNSTTIHIKNVPVDDTLVEPECPEVLANESEEFAKEDTSTYVEFDPGVIMYTCSFNSFNYYETYIDYKYYSQQVSIKLDFHWQKYLYTLCKKYDIEYEFVLATFIYESAGADVYLGLDRESGYTKPAIDQKTGKYCTHVGIGSLSVYYNYNYFKALGLDILTPEGSMEAAVIALSDKYQSFNASSDSHRMHRALIAYNDGNGGLASALSKGIWKTGYSSRVMQIREGLLNNR